MEISIFCIAAEEILLYRKHNAANNVQRTHRLVSYLAIEISYFVCSEMRNELKNEESQRLFVCFMMIKSEGLLIMLISLCTSNTNSNMYTELPCLKTKTPQTRWRFQGQFR